MKFEALIPVLTAADLGQPGESIFIDWMPSDVNTGILLRNPLQGVPVDHQLPGRYRHKFQAIVRDRDTAAGNKVADRVCDALVMRRTQLDDIWVDFIRLASLPITYPRTVGNVIEWSINFDCCFTVA